MNKFALSLLFVFSVLGIAQQPQTTLAPIYDVNATYSQGVGTGYWPTTQAIPKNSLPAATGLNINIASGTSYCGSSIQTYAGGTITLTASSTNYIYLNTSSSCAVTVNTSGFTSSTVPIATILTGLSSITTIVDDRTLFNTTTGNASGTFVLEVNGTPTSPRTPVNLNNTTPAAPGGHQNIACQQDGSANVSCNIPTPSSPLDIQHNGSDVTDQSKINFLDIPPTLPLGYTPCTWSTDSSGGIGCDVPPIASSFTMQTIPPTTGQFAIVDFTVVSNPGGGVNCIRPSASAAGTTTSGAALACGDPFDPETAGLTWSVPVLPSYIIPANVTAIYLVFYGGGSIEGAGSYTMGCSGGSGINPIPYLQNTINMGSFAGWNGTNIGSQTCNIQASDSQGAPAYGGIGIDLIEMYVYYTGTAPPATSQVNVMPPLYWNPASQILGIKLPYNSGTDTGVSGSAYVVNILGFPGVVDGNYPGIPLPGNLPGSDIWFTPAHSNASSAPTLDFNGITQTITGPTGGTLTNGDISTSTGQDAHVHAEPNGTWALQNPQVSGGSGGFPITLGSTSIAANSTTTSVSGLTLVSPTLTGTPDASGATQFKLPVASSFASAANGELGYDSSGKNWNVWGNGVTNLMVLVPTASLPTNGNCAQWVVSGGVYSLGQASGACGTGGGGGDSITSPLSTINVGGTSTNTTLDVAAINTLLDTSTPVTVSTTKPSEFHFNQNATAGTAITYDLPTAAAGKQFCFKNSYNGSAGNTGTLELLTSAAGQYIINLGVESASGGYVISAGALGDAACVVGLSSTVWSLYVESGTWTLH